MAIVDGSFEPTITRLVKLMAAITVVGTAATLAWRGWKWAAGFAVGAAISGLNFYWLKRLTDSLGSTRVRRRSAVFLASRYIVLGLMAYVILRYSSISLPAALAGLFVSTAAVIVEILFELKYGPK
jgi:TRAP-type C4-dicarboxylate transport system permease small subunit